jgi:hypothetical protein
MHAHTTPAPVWVHGNEQADMGVEGVAGGCILGTRSTLVTGVRLGKINRWGHDGELVAGRGEGFLSRVLLSSVAS